jgi:hypothetical protein
MKKPDQTPLLDQITAPAPPPATAEETAQAAYAKLLDTTPQLDSVLGDLIAAADGIKTKAGRLLASNR